VKEAEHHPTLELVLQVARNGSWLKSAIIP